jgi:uncharacterized protein (TIGR02147 family)
VKQLDIVDVFGYRDYRRYLADVYKVRKKTEYGFSYRSFAKRVGSTAPNYLKLVTEGKRNLTPEMAGRFAAALGLAGKSRDFFCDLVEFNQAASTLDRQRFYERLKRYPRYRSAFRLDAAHAAYHSEWYIPAIRELVACDGFREDPKWIAHRLVPNISPRQADKALDVLLKLGLLVRDSDGTLRQNEPVLTTGDERPLGHHVVTYHRKMMERAAEALDTFPREEREIASLTLSLNMAQTREFKQRLYQLRQELLQASLEAEPDAEPPCHVVQINFQMFALTRRGEGSESK